MNMKLLYAAIFAALSHGQALKFDVAAIRPSAPVGASFHTSIHTGNNTFRTLNTTLLDLIQNAYDVRPYQIFGAPGWVRSSA